MSFRTGLLWICCLLCASSSGRAIVMRHDVDEAAYRALAVAVDVTVTFVREGRNGGDRVSGEGTHIGGGWVLTAAHVANHLGEAHRAAIGDERYPLVRVVVHPEWQAGRLPNDVALVKLDGEPAARTSLADQAVAVGTEVLFVGRGDRGDGRRGIVESDGVRRGARNVVSAIEGEWMVFVFDPPDQALPLEGISGPGDSGGPALVGSPGHWTLVGVSCWQDTRPTGRREGLYGVIEHYARVGVHRSWIDAVRQGDTP